MPVGRYTDADLATSTQTTPGADESAPQGLLSSIGEQFGITKIPSLGEVGHMLFDPRQGPGVQLIKGAVQGGKRILGEAYDAGASLAGSESAPNTSLAERANQAGLHLIKAIPFAGPAMDKMADQAAENGATGDDYLNDLASTITSPGAMGTAIGASANIAPLLDGVPGVRSALKPIRALAPAVERGGYGIINHAVDATPKMMKYGANPARGLIDSGAVPSMSKFSLGNKLQKIVPEAGQDVSNAVHGSPRTVPSADVASSIESPINRARGVATGPGGSGVTRPLDTLQGSMTARAPGAVRPIYGEGSGIPYSTKEVVDAMGISKPKGLPAPIEETPLHSSPDVRGRLSRPITLQSSRALPRDSPYYGYNEPTVSAPQEGEYLGEPIETPGLVDRHGAPEPFGNLGPNEYMGEAPGARGGLGQPQGVIRRTPNFGESSQPSPFSDMRHPASTPNDVWRTIQNIDRNTRFNPDPEIEGVNEIRRDIRHGLRGNLEEAVPGLRPISRRYGDLVTAEDALSRNAGKGSPLAKIGQAASFPLETTAGTAMVKGGRALSKSIPSPLLYAAPANPFRLNQKKEQ